MGYLTDVSDAFSSLHTDYDDAGRATRVQTLPHPGVPGIFQQPATTIDFDYDNNNNTRYYQFGGESVVYSYDTNNRLRTIYKENTGGFGFAYDDADRLTQRTLPNNTETRYYYFNAQPYTGLLMEQQHAVSNSTILIEAQHVSDYNLSNPTPTIRSVDVRAPEGNSKYVYGYQTIDDRASPSRSFLTSATYTSPTLSRLDLFRYSLEGNRRNSYSVQAPAPSVAKCAPDWTTCPGATAFNYEHDGKSDSWDSSKTNRVIEDTGHIYQYDADGNMVMRKDKATGNRTIYSYTVDNQLTRAETYTPAGDKLMESNYRYDALGRRIVKVVGRPGSGQPPYIRKYVYLGDNPLAAYDETNNLVTRYEYTGAVDDILMVKEDLNRDGNLTLDGDNEFFYYKDLLGNVTHIIGKNHNNKVKQYKYSPYGQLFSEWTSPGIHPNFENNILFTAREWDAELGLYYLRARHYDPDTGKFLQEDPVFDLNAYTYGNNNPTLFSDPFGDIEIHHNIDTEELTVLENRDAVYGPQEVLYGPVPANDLHYDPDWARAHHQGQIRVPLGTYDIIDVEWLEDPETGELTDWGATQFDENRNRYQAFGPVRIELDTSLTTWNGIFIHGRGRPELIGDACNNLPRAAGCTRVCNDVAIDLANIIEGRPNEAHTYTKERNR